MRNYLEVNKINLFGFIVLLSSCTGDCTKLPEEFSSYQNAIKEIKSTSFEIEESIQTSKSSWIRNAAYYSCDEKVGFMLLKTDSKEYLYQNVPLKTWVGFKNASSFGTYYNKNIKHNYSLKLVN